MNTKYIPNTWIFFLFNVVDIEMPFSENYSRGNNKNKTRKPSYFMVGVICHWFTLGFTKKVQFTKNYTQKPFKNYEIQDDGKLFIFLKLHPAGFERIY